jgi:hypothetical protein
MKQLRINEIRILSRDRAKIQIEGNLTVLLLAVSKVLFCGVVCAPELATKDGNE